MALLAVPPSSDVLRTAQDFNDLYATQDPWRVDGHGFRTKALRRAIGRYVAGRRVLELGCGEGNLTGTIFADAALVHGVDISDVAVARARRRGLHHATFEISDMLRVETRGYDVIALIEALYYLDVAEQDQLLARIAGQHRGVTIISAPITGGKYFTDGDLRETFRRHGLRLIEARNLSVDFSTPARLLLGQAIRRCGSASMLDLLPERFVRQRIYVLWSGGEHDKEGRRPRAAPSAHIP
jgi:2-polyprenyl-3-methyl-5-hydroxy-6-metoxy-1,4-benzoquinol methylase